MHAQAESVPEHRAHFASSLHVASGLGLYLLTLTGEAMLGAGVRWLLTYLGVSALGVLLPLGPGAEQLAWFAALAPLVWSLAGLFFPGRAWIWRRRLGARAPSAEEASAIDDALALLRSIDPSLPGPSGCYVLDEPLPEAYVRGRTVILSRGLVDSDALAAALAHELSHVNSLDGRLTEALGRLALWGDPLAPPRPERGEEDRFESRNERGGVLLGCARWVLRAAGGTLAQQLLSPLWAAHWRAREFAADAYAASLGQGEDLARHLCEQVLPFDVPQRRLLFNAAQHPPTAHRIERLLANFEGTGSE
ncbi:MAG TPA: M48 family metalloprotease [Solirubrobacterales bacterium]|nr:M48 family metalloprotease [Solirubrobacterales bacterium]